MLKKLIKWELKAGVKLIPLLWLGSLGGGLLGMLGVLLIGRISDSVSSLASGFLILIGIALIFISLITIVASALISTYYPVYRYYRTMASDEAYLMFTLPTPRKNHLNTQIISSIIWGFGGIFVSIISALFIFFGYPDLFEIFKSIIQDIYSVLFANIGEALPFIILLLIYLIINFIYGTVVYFTGITIGQGMLKSKVGGAFLGCFIMYIISSVVSVVISFLATLLSAPFINDSNAYALTLVQLIIQIVIYSSLTLGMYFFILNRLNNKYNLD